MEYTGKLYGKIGRRMIPLTLTSEDVDKMERQKDAAVMLAGELVAIIRVNAMRGTWAEATPEQVDEFLVPWIAKLRVAQGHSPENAQVL